MLTSVTLEQAIEILKQPRQRGQRGGAPAALATLGPSPITQQPITVRTGRFGAYVTDGVVNATIPSGRDPQRLTLEDALDLIGQREQRLREQGIDARAGGKPGRPGKRGKPARLPQAVRPAAIAAKASAAKKAAKKPAAEKPAAEKPAKGAPKKTADKKPQGKKSVGKSPPALKNVRTLPKKAAKPAKAAKAVKKRSRA
jgi:DNA topoisomerase-1